MSEEKIDIYGAKEHNLKNIDISIPRNQLVVFTGLSGSGKSSLAFDTLFAEGQRRYIETFSSYARQFIGGMERPDVDKIEGLSPVISIEQKTISKSPRSTVEQLLNFMTFSDCFFHVYQQHIHLKLGRKMKYSEEQRELLNTTYQTKNSYSCLKSPCTKRSLQRIIRMISQMGYTKAQQMVKSLMFFLV